MAEPSVDPTFDPVIARVLAAYAERVDRPFEPRDLAVQALAAPARPRVSRPALLLLAAALAVGGVLLGAFAAARLAPQLPEGRLVTVTRAADGGAVSVSRMDATATAWAPVVSGSAEVALSPSGRHAVARDAAGYRLLDTATGATVALPIPAGATLYQRYHEATRDEVANIVWSDDDRWLSWVACTAVDACTGTVASTDGSVVRPMPLAGPAPVRPDAVPFWAFLHGYLYLDPQGGGPWYLAAEDGSGLHEMTSDEQLLVREQGGFLVSGGEDGLQILGPAGTVLWRHVDPWSKDGYRPAGWTQSPAGDRVAVVTAPRTSFPQVSGAAPATADGGPLWIVGADGNDVEADLGGDVALPSAVTWSPDGTHVAVTALGGPSFARRDVLVVDAATGVTARVEGATDLAWAPSGAWLAVDDTSAPGRVRVVSADGRERRALPETGGGTVTALAWTD